MDGLIAIDLFILLKCKPNSKINSMREHFDEYI